jgi:tetratricopeptide (TPR) repeat protein
LSDSLGQRIKYYRNLRRISQSQLALGICSVSYLSKVENGRLEASDEIKELLYERLEVSKSDIEKKANLKKKLKVDVQILDQKIQRSCEGILNFFQSLETKYISINDPYTLLIKDLIRLRMAILNDDKKLSSFYFSELSKYKNLMDGFSKHYYFRFAGLYHYVYGSLETSLKFYKSAEKLSEGYNKEDIYYQLSLIYTRLEQVSLSNYYVIKALNIYQTKMLFSSCLDCNLLMGVNYRKMGQHQEAIKTFQLILNEESRGLEKETKSKIHHNLGLIYFELSRLEEAVKSLEESLQYKENESNKINTIYLLAKVYSKQFNVDKATNLILEGKEKAIANQRNDYLIKFQVLYYIVLSKENNKKLGNYLQDIALPFFIQKEEHKTVQEYSILLAEFYEQEHKYKQAYYLLKNLIKN